MAFVPNEHETSFNLIPVGINYTCEFCGKGHMIADPNEPVIVELTNPPSMAMRTHICDECHMTMKLPKTYPYVEWMTPEEYGKLMSVGFIPTPNITKIEYHKEDSI